MSFEGRTIAITGAASGIGRALALELARRGSDVAICDVDEDGLEETARGVESAGRRVTRSRVDVADRAAMHAFAERSIEAHGRIDGIVNNAGVSLTNTVANMSYEDLEWIVGINFWGVIHGTKAFLPHLLERRDGWIVNLSSVFGIVAFPSQAAYNATKFAVRGFTECLRQELAGTGVTAISVHPGGIKTNIARRGRFVDSFDGADDKETMVEEFDRIARTSPEDAARVIVRGMERRSPRVLIGADALVIDTVQRLAPVRYPDVFGAVAKRVRGRPSTK